uniref:Putative PD-(D/E)XK nuclease superfamily protein n=1 Tax=viral metagenome TaxID=1070528 RepID=A0A6M3KF08_9ZZZZ
MPKDAMPNPEPSKLRLSASRCAVYAHCPAKYAWTYQEQLTPKGKARPLVIGSLIHRLVHQQTIGKLPSLKKLQNYDEVVTKHFPEVQGQEAVSIASEAITLFNGYVHEYESDPLETVSSEMHLEKDMGDYLLYARVDSLRRTQDKRMWRGELKTTSRLDSLYLQGLKGGMQAGISYILLRDSVPEKVYGTVYDLIVKTKTPQYHRSPVLAEHHLSDLTERMLKGVYEGIKNERFHPSMQCISYNRQCDYMPLCRQDSKRVREAFYEHRPDTIPVNEDEED